MRRIPSKVFTGLMLLLVVAWASVAGASDRLLGEVRFKAAEQEVRWVGQQQELHLELWTDGFSFADQQFVLPEVRGGYLLQPDASTIKLNESRDGVQWQGLRYTLLLWPQRGGTLDIPSFDVSFTARAGFGTEPAKFRQSTPSLQIQTRMPPGVDPGGLLVTTGSFSMTSAWTPEVNPDGTANLSVGDAITLEVTRKAQDVPGMVFSPLPEFNIDGLGSYAAAPRVNDRVNRGTLSGERTDSVTFICESEGTYQLPELRFQWWDPDGERLSGETVGAVQLSVASNPAWAAGGESAADGAHWAGWKPAAIMLGSLLVILAGGYAFYPRLKNYVRRRQQAVRATERWAFQQAVQSCKSGEPAEAYRAINLWLGRVQSLRPGITLLALAELRGDEALKKEATTLQERVASGLTEEWRGGKLAQLLIQSREGMDQPSEASHVLHALNPPLLK